MATIVNIQNFEIEERAFASAFLLTRSEAKTPCAALPARDNRLLSIVFISLAIHAAALFAVFVFFLGSPESGAGQSFVLVEISGLMGDSGSVSRGGPLSVKGDGLTETAAAAVVKVRKKEEPHLVKKPSPAAASEKAAAEIKPTVTPVPVVSIALGVITDDGGEAQDKPPVKSEAALETRPVAAMDGEGINFLLAEDAHAADATGAETRTSETLMGDENAETYAYPAEPRSGIAAYGGEAVGARAQSGGRGVLIEGLKRPSYPAFSRLRGENGTVRLQVMVGADGRHGKIKVLISSGFARLDRAALKALEKARFIPAISYGRPTASTKTVVFVFKLKD